MASAPGASCERGRLFLLKFATDFHYRISWFEVGKGEERVEELGCLTAASNFGLAPVATCELLTEQVCLKPNCVFWWRWETESSVLDTPLKWAEAWVQNKNLWGPLFDTCDAHDYRPQDQVRHFSTVMTFDSIWLVSVHPAFRFTCCSFRRISCRRYFNDWCLYMISNQSASPDLWPLTISRIFPSHSCH